MCLDDVNHWIRLNRYEEIKRKAENHTAWRTRQPSTEKMSHHDGHNYDHRCIMYIVYH